MKRRKDDPNSDIEQKALEEVKAYRKQMQDEEWKAWEDMIQECISA